MAPMDYSSDRTSNHSTANPMIARTVALMQGYIINHHIMNTDYICDEVHDDYTVPIIFTQEEDDDEIMIEFNEFTRIPTPKQGGSMTECWMNDIPAKAPLKVPVIDPRNYQSIALVDIPKSLPSISEQVVSTIATDGDIVANVVDNGDDNGAYEGDNVPNLVEGEAKAAVHILSTSVILCASSSDGGTTVLDEGTRVVASSSTSSPSNSYIKASTIISSSDGGTSVVVEEVIVAVVAGLGFAEPSRALSTLKLEQSVNRQEAVVDDDSSEEWNNEADDDDD